MLLGHAKINTGDKAMAGYKCNVHTKLVLYNEKTLSHFNLQSLQITTEVKTPTAP